MSRTIVIIHPGALGDVLLAVPAMRRLRVRFPQHQIILCANDQASELLAECHVIDRWLSVQGMACLELFGGSISVTSELSRWLARCDGVIAWVKDKEGTLAAAMRRCGAREVRVVSLLHCAKCKTSERSVSRNVGGTTSQSFDACAVTATRPSD